MTLRTFGVHSVFHAVADVNRIVGMIIVLELPADARRDGISVNKIGRVTPMPNAAILLEAPYSVC